MEDLINIKVLINGAPHYLVVKRDEEPYYRMAAEHLNELIKQYKESFSISYIELITRVAFDLAVQLSKKDCTPEQEKALNDILKAL